MGAFVVFLPIILRHNNNMSIGSFGMSFSGVKTLNRVISFFAHSILIRGLFALFFTYLLTFKKIFSNFNPYIILLLIKKNQFTKKKSKKYKKN